MAGRNFGRNLYRFSAANRPLAPGANPSAQDSASYDGGRQYPSATRDKSLEPQARSPPLSPRRDQPLPASPTYSIKKTTSPPSSPTYRASPAARVISSPPKTLDEYPKYKPTNQPRSPEARQKPRIISKAIEKVTKSDRGHHETSKTMSSQKAQQTNAINIKGENVGAVMEIVESPKREGGHVIKKKETTIDQSNEANSKTPNSSASMPTSTFLNSNFQSVNNSLLYNATLTHRDPGLHLAFSRNPIGDRLSHDDHKKQHHTRSY